MQLWPPSKNFAEHCALFVAEVYTSPRRLERPQVRSRDGSCPLTSLLSGTAARDFFIYIGAISNSMHVLLSHIPFYLRRYGSLVPYCQQGVERHVKLVKETRHSIVDNRGSGVLGVMEAEARRVTWLLRDAETAAATVSLPPRLSARRKRKDVATVDGFVVVPAKRAPDENAAGER